MASVVDGVDHVLASETAVAQAVSGGGHEADDASYTVWLARARSPLRERDVHIDFCPDRYNPQPLPAAAAALVDAQWASRLAANPRLFNATKYRLAAVEELADGTVRLGLGISDYKTFLGTNRATDPALVAALPQPAAPVLSDILGCTALVVTSDGLIPIGRRSMQVSEYRGWWDVAGGHPEPSRAGVDAQGHAAVAAAAATAAADAARGDAMHGDADEANAAERTRRELFASARDEVRAELNVPLASVGQPLLAGVLRAHASRGRPSLIFLVPVALTGAQVVECYLQGGDETDESTELALFTPEVLRAGSGAASLFAHPCNGHRAKATPDGSSKAKADGSSSKADGSSKADAASLDFKDIAPLLVATTHMCFELIKAGLLDSLST